MYCEVYVDVFFVVNLISGFFVLCLTTSPYRSCQFCKSAFRCGSGSGGKLFYSCIFKRIAKSEKRDFLCGDSSGYGELWMQCKRTEKSDFENACISWMQLLLGGFLFVFSQRARRGIFTFGAITTCCYWTLYIGIRLCKYLKRKRELCCEVGIALSGKEINVKGLYDTGNCLYDRATGKSVCVMEKDSFFQLLTEKQQRFLENFCAMNMVEEKLAEEEAAFFRGLNPRFLPYTSVGCQKGLLPVVTVDKLIVREQEEERKILHAAVGISYTKLSEKGRFQAIISPGIWEK